jgi:hypothetical protein
MHGGCMVAMSYIGRYILVENSPYSWMRRGIVSSLEGKKKNWMKMVPNVYVSTSYMYLGIFHNNYIIFRNV